MTLDFTCGNVWLSIINIGIVGSNNRALLSVPMFANLIRVLSVDNCQ